MLCSHGWCFIYMHLFSYRKGCPPRINPITNYFYHCGEPTPEDAESSSLGLSVNNLYSGVYLHADDIRILASSASSLQAQISEVLNFTSNSFFQLNHTKCEVVSFAQCKNINNPECKIEEKIVPTSGTAKCLATYGTMNFLLSHQFSTTL